MKTLTRSQDDRMIGGVCGGLARSLGIDSTLVRLAFVFITLTGGAGVLIYLILLFVMPLDTVPGGVVNSISGEQQKRTGIWVGGALILLGTWYLLGTIPGLSWISLHNFWPLLLIVAGAYLVARYYSEREIE